ncbi:MAG: ribosomal protein S18-alanine N-acetyltransferase [Candidatus Caldarchaeum sp.]|jgi:ribosomal-protein-alanine N-acetyltransferase|uniref:Ribosomal-protein-alanine N-acetyltransferase n=1 Tax=Caldiarchaeum subterraneum TaxID=311458 RepID=A0A7C4E1I5_CALS0|nr:ribosomal protein S18-alanine N-acetyltransferase [Candidatus Caldarchaeales archaeon]
MQQASKLGDIDVVFRNVTQPDLIDVMNINRLCLPENYTYSFFDELAKDYPKAFWVAEVGDKLVGYIMCRVERVFSKIDFLKIRRAGHIVSVAVLPNYRNRGIGEQLIRRALHSLANDYGCEEAFLEVRVSNHVAISLYRKIGFVVKEVHRRYYADGEDAYVMVVKLPLTG